MQATAKIFWPLMDLLKGSAQVQAMHANTMVSGLSLDSRSTRTGDLFFALQGLQKHGLEFSQQVIANGAVAIVWEAGHSVHQDDLPNVIPCVQVDALQHQLGAIAERFYHSPAKHINVIGVTGTDGKTSVSQFIAQALAHLKISCGVIGTLGYGVYPALGTATHTTPDAIRTQALLYQFFENEVLNAVIEASSHGLKQGRLNNVAFNTAVLTNLGRDHIDYHTSLEDYANSKRLLFEIPTLENAVINIDDAFGRQLANQLSKHVNVVCYSSYHDKADSGAYIYAKSINAKQKITSIEIHSSWGNATIKTNLYGKFTVSNLLAAMGALLVSDCSFADTVKAIASVQTVPGRMQPIACAHDAPSVIVDYAHTPQALKNVLQALGEQCMGKLWCVFGCGGDRDHDKRKLMGEVVEQYADNIIVTDDNPRSEDPVSIAQAIISGFSDAGNHSLIHDRKQAIAYAINNAACEDTVLIAGKGHEVVQIINNEQLPFDDTCIATQCLQNYKQ